MNEIAFFSFPHYKLKWKNDEKWMKHFQRNSSNDDDAFCSLHSISMYEHNWIKSWLQHFPNQDSPIQNKYMHRLKHGLFHKLMMYEVFITD